jgi:hypothetical protein
MKRFSVLIALLAGVQAGLTSGAAAETDDGNVSICATCALERDVLPGQTVTWTVTVTNPSSSENEIREEAIVPAGWHVITPTDSCFTLAGGETRLRLVVIGIPAWCPAGAYPVRYSAGLGSTARPDTGVVFTTRVTAFERIEISLKEGPKTVIAGYPYGTHLKVLNTGNVQTSVAIKVTANPAGAVHLDREELRLAPSDGALLAVNVPTNAGLKRPTRYLLRAQAVPLSPGQSLEWVSETVSFDVVPSGGGRQRECNMLPTEIRLATACEKGWQHFQADFSASGKLDDAGTRRVAVVMRGPSMEHVGKYGRRDEYVAEYHGGLTDVALGDRTYSLSPLTERYLYGRGGEIDIHYGGLAIGGLYVDPRWQNQQAQRVGGYVSVRPHDATTMRVNALIAEGDTVGGGDGRRETYSVSMGIRPSSAMDCTLEYGLGNRRGENGNAKHAYRAEAHGTPFRQVRYAFERIHGEPAYPGLYCGTDFTSGSLMLPVVHDVSGIVVFNSHTTEREDRDASLNRDRVQLFRTGVSDRFGRAVRVSFTYEDFRRRMCGAYSESAFSEKAVRASIGRTAPGLSITCSAERGILRNDLSGEGDRSLERYILSAYFRPAGGQAYSLNSTIGHSRFTDSPQREVSASASGNWRLGASLSLGLDYVLHFNESLVNGRRQDFFSTVTYRLPNAHAITIKGYLETGEKHEVDRGSIYLAYAIPYGVRIGYKEPAGNLKGTVYDIEVADRPPLQGVVLKADGAYAVTGEKGEFLFRNLKPGLHLLEVDQRSIGFDRTVAQSPLQAVIEAGETAVMQIGVVTSCDLEGQVSLYVPADSSSLGRRIGLDYGPRPASSVGEEDGPPSGLIDRGGLPDVPVEIKNGSQTLHQTTDRHGKFRFAHLKPGTWTIVLSKDDLPGKSGFELQSIAVQLAPGEQRYVVARVIRRMKPLHVIETGSIGTAER